ncbi:hypothetical protein NPIL_439551 [Nephila pilipes]|uniref:Uncharacterized protein n=1 Tax=Nephila pilipes TaxID=299642 RepID=A0A8X6IXX8_NEPPI|nr:hypothetical protein NPIL_439551 [Nephila pilipes]
MADVTAIENSENEPSREDTRKCENINFVINQLVQTNNVIFALEAKLNTIPLFPHCYGPNEMEEVRKELTRFKEERTRNQGEFNLSLPCPIKGCLHHSQFNNTNLNLNFNQTNKNKKTST